MLAEVLIPESRLGTLSYLIPEKLSSQIIVGIAVRVPLQNRLVLGYIFRLQAVPVDPKFALKEIESVIASSGGVAIRIDKEHPLEDLVGRIKKEIKGAIFVIADLTDERPSCYFEVGYAEALDKPLIYIASKQSVAKPGTQTKIHFDIHMNVQFFTNHGELKEKLTSAIKKNRATLFEKN